MADTSPHPPAETTPISTPITNGDTTTPHPTDTAPLEAAPVELLSATSVDVEMKDTTDANIATPTFSQTPQHQQQPSTHLTPTPQPAPVTSSTPTRNSPHPSVAPQAPPAHANPHGSPTRVYLNQNVTPHLLEAMKHLVTNEPDKPLKWLSEFLAQKSLEIEGP